VDSEKGKLLSKATKRSAKSSGKRGICVEKRVKGGIKEGNCCQSKVAIKGKGVATVEWRVFGGADL